jgi:ketosteroid isomerase-like protein
MTELAALIEHLSNRWMRAWLDRDRVVLEAILAPDFEFVSSAVPARRFDRQAWLAAALGPYRCSVFRYRDVQVSDLGGGYALMSAVGGQIAELDGHDRSGAFFITDVWRRTATGDWQVCARHASHPEPAGESAAALARFLSWDSV